MKKILVAADSFKGSLSSKEIADIFAEQAREENLDAVVTGVSIADGGEGTLDAVLSCGKYREVKIVCRNPLFDDVTARYALGNGEAVVEMAEASGLTLIDYADGNALKTTTYGTGELIADAVKNGAKHVYVCVGGSATNDGGAGALSALGVKFFDEKGDVFLPIGGTLDKISGADTEGLKKYDGVKFTLVADVDNPLLGKTGATMFYGGQKGAVGKDFEVLENGMKNYAEVTEKVTGASIGEMKSAGAAGGLAGGLIAYLGAEVRSGIGTVLEIIGFDKYLDGKDAVVTGEGRIDEQSLHGKAVCGVCAAARKKNAAIYAIAGCTSLSAERYEEIGIRHIETLVSYAESAEDSINNAKKYAEKAAKKLLKIICEEE